MPGTVQWVLLFLPSLALALLFQWAALPAAFLIGPMLVAVAAGTSGATIRPPAIAFSVAQALVGCLIAMSIDFDILAALADDWYVFAAVVVATMASSGLLGYTVSRWSRLPGSTAVWGSTPGASTVMVLMAEAFGADARLVAFMQYLRVVMVSLVAALVAHMALGPLPADAPGIDWFPAVEPMPFLTMTAIALGGMLAGYALRLPSAAFLGPMLLGSGLHLAGLVEFQIPPWLLAAGYMVIGWTIGLKFDRRILRHALTALPQILLSILALIGFCAALAMLLVVALGIDPLTAYLATSPGGMDTITIIAATATGVNLPFVLALQTARFLFILIFGPAITRLIVRALPAA